MKYQANDSMIIYKNKSGSFNTFFQFSNCSSILQTSSTSYRGESLLEPKIELFPPGSQMQFPYVIAVAPNNSQKCGKWQHLSANQAIF